MRFGLFFCALFLSASALAADRTAHEYALECLKEMGVKPESLPEYMSCTDASTSFQVPYNDSFTWLTGEVDYNRISRKDVGDVILMLNCRQKKANLKISDDDYNTIFTYDPFQLGQTQDEREAAHVKTKATWTFDSTYGFHDIAMIIHQQSSGKTCFFQDFDLGQLTLKYGAQVPMPYAKKAAVDVKQITSEIEKLNSDTKDRNGNKIKFKSTIIPNLVSTAERFWVGPKKMAEQIKCSNCHDSGPWIRSPRWAEVKDASGKKVVPSRASNNGLPTLPYHIVGAELRTAWFTEKQPRVVSTDDIPSIDRKSTTPQSCVMCHAVGGLKSTNREDYPNDRGLRQYYSSWVDLETLYPVAYFLDDPTTKLSDNPRMPPLAKKEDRHDMREWDENYLRPYKALQCCGDFPNALGCKTAMLGDAKAPKDWKWGSDVNTSCLPPVVTAQVSGSAGERVISWEAKYAKTCEIKLLSSDGKVLEKKSIKFKDTLLLKNASAVEAELTCNAGWVVPFPSEKTHSVKIKLLLEP